MKKQQNGFTIVEVLIVLSIVGLLLSIVFLAIPALQRNSRNYRRNNDAARVLALVAEQKSLSGRFPWSCNNTVNWCFLRNTTLSYYDNKSLTLNNVSFHLRSSAYTGSQEIDVNDPLSVERISVRSWTKCLDNGEFTGVGAGPNNLAAQYAMESFNNSFLVCKEL
jgi:prepilin-type N-terminal cleavage/methylation domain-containing protein